MDHRSIQLFEEALKHGKETVYNIQIMFAGCLNVGKTTLVKRLLGQEVDISQRNSTEGIDVYLHCCDVSLSTYEWIRRAKDSKQDYKLQRLVKVLNENYQAQGEVVDDASSNQRETTDSNPNRLASDDDKNAEVLCHQLQKQNDGQIVSPTSTLQRGPASPVVQSSLTQSETSTQPGSEFRENATTEHYNTDPLREMLKLLQQNPDITKLDENKYAWLTMMDFAGQYAFYTTHQMFLLRRAIYLFVSDSSKEVSDLVLDECFFDTKGVIKCNFHELVDIWMNSIHSCAQPVKDSSTAESSHAASSFIPPPVILVGTHIDQIQKISGAPSPVQDDEQAQGENCRKLGQRYLQGIRSYLKDKPTVVHLVDEDFAIDNTVVDSEMEKLKRKIIDVAKQQPYWGEQIPTRWFLLEQQLMRLKDAGVKVMTRIAVDDINKEGTVQIKDSEEMDLFLTYLHETGTIIYFNVKKLKDNVVLDPTWLIDALKSLINAGGDNDNTQEMLDLKEKGIINPKVVETIWTKELPAHKSHALMLMEQLNIIAKVRVFDVMGVKEKDYFLAPCMLRQEVPAEVISPEQDASVVTTPEMRFIFTGKYLPIPIFHRLLAACIDHWPVAKKEKSEHLIFCGCCVFNLDLFHRLTVYIKSHIVYANVTRKVIDVPMPPDAGLCSHARRFISVNLTKITSYLGQNLQYELEAPDSPWREDCDSDVTLTAEHMNHQRLTVALVKVGGNAMREILCVCLPPNTDLRRVILANKTKLMTGPGKLERDQINLVFPDPQTIGKVIQFDISLLYKLIRNISTVLPHSSGWGNEPQNNPRDKSLGASVERIRFYRNDIAHSKDGKVSNQDFDDYWGKFEAVIDDIEDILGNQGYKTQLKKLKTQVISVYESS